MEKFRSQIAEILEVDSVELDQELEAFECWDSLTLLSIIALASDNYNVTLSGEDIRKSLTIGGLQDLIKSKMS